MQKSSSTAELCAIGVLDQGDEAIDEVEYRLMFSEPPSVDSDTFGNKSYHGPHVTDERFTGVGVGGVGVDGLRTSISLDCAKRSVPRNVSSESIRSDSVVGSDRLQRYTRRGVGSRGAGMFRSGADGVNEVQNEGAGGGESSLRTSISPDRTDVPRNVSSESMRSDAVDTSDRTQLYTRRGARQGGGVFANGVEGVNGVDDGMGKLRPSNTNMNEKTANGTFMSNSVSMPHSLDAYFDLYACREVTEDKISSSHAQNGKLLSTSTSQESISRRPYGGGSSKVSSSHPTGQSLPRLQSSPFITSLTKANSSSISQTLSDTALLENFARLAVEGGKHTTGSKDSTTQGGGLSWQPPSVESVVGYEIDTPVSSPQETPRPAPTQPVADESPHQFHQPMQQQQYQPHHSYQHLQHPYHEQYAFNQYHKGSVSAAQSQGLGENGGFDSPHLVPDAAMVHSLGVTEFLPGLPPHLANDRVALYNALLVEQSMSMAAMNQRRLPTYMAPGNNYMAACSTADVALAQPPQAALLNTFQLQHPGAKTTGVAYQPPIRDGYYFNGPSAVEVREGPMVGRAGGHGGASSLGGVSGSLYNPQGVSSIHHTTAADAYIYKVRFKKGTRTFSLGQKAEPDLMVGNYVKVEADRGEDLGVIASILPNVQGTIHSGMKRELIIRRATKEEIVLLNDKLSDEAKVLELCRAQARQRLLPMEVIDAEFQYDRNKLTFFFRAEGRVDFRELVRDLFSIYKTRIWMQQVDEQHNTTYPLPDVDMRGGGWPPPQQQF